MAGESRKVEDAWLEDHQRSLHLRRIIFIMSACLYHNDGATHFLATRDSDRRFHAETCCARKHGRSVFDHRHRPHNLILQ
jgi:hypothetical protein